MNVFTSPQRRRLLLAVAALGLAAPASLLAQATAPGATATAAKSDDSDESIILSPFTVTTSKDSGYKATNSISGSRIDTAIKDIPMPIEVITDQFIRDSGATDLRQALRYSAGVLLQTQNDQGNTGSSAYHGPGGVNNPEGVTSDPSATYIKVRGFVTSTMLRDGFRRQNATDSVNLARVEVVRGPAALLYGIGNFGGIVNYLTKTPSAKPFGEATVVVGMNNFLRSTIDQTGPITKDGKLAYRINAAIEDTDEYTDFYHQKHWFVSPVIEYKPFEKSSLLFDFEVGERKVNGMGFQQVRSVAGVGVNNDQNEHGGLFTVPGTDPKTFRLSGPDTYQNQQSSNLEIKYTQELLPNLNLFAGWNHSTFNYQQRDVIGSLNVNVGPTSLRRTVVLFPVDPSTPDSNTSVKTGPVEGVILQYNWQKNWFEDTRDQERVELNYKLPLFGNSNRWLHMEHGFLAGLSLEKNDQATWSWGTVANSNNYYAPDDKKGIRYGVQGDGTPDVGLEAISRTDSLAWDKAVYGVYQGTYLDKHLHVLAGVRQDKNDLQNTFTSWNNPTTSSFSRRPQAVDTTRQYGASFAITREISIYGMQSQGLDPNFSGAKDGYGNPLGAVTAKSKEVGLKLDLFNGKLSATISKYKITKEGTPISFWWAPSAIGGKTKWDTSKDIVYNVNNFTPTSVAGGSNGGNGACDASLAQWNTALGSGAAYQKNGNWYVNATKADGAAYLDSVFNYTSAHGYTWPGWLYNYDTETNNSWVDISSTNGTSQTGTSESKGYDGQLLFTPTDNIQIVLNYAYTEVTIINPGNFIKYPSGNKDRWAVWYFPNTDWGLTSQKTSTMYTDPQDTSTWTGYGYGAGTKADDTPKHHVDAFGIYRFKKGALDGLSLGLGGYWESQREYLSGITHGSGQKITDANGNAIVRATPCRLNLDMMASYSWKSKSGKHPQTIQLNINNLLNDTDTYGLIYSAPLNARLEYRYGW